MLDDLSSRPYFIRAVYHWCIDKHYTPYLLVHWDEETAPAAVPARLAQDGKIVFNISPAAVRHFVIDDDAVCFTARFLGRTADIRIPLTDVISIYAQERQSGLSFPAVPAAAAAQPEDKARPPEDKARRKPVDIKMI